MSTDTTPTLLKVTVLAPKRFAGFEGHAEPAGEGTYFVRFIGRPSHEMQGDIFYQNQLQFHFPTQEKQ